MSRNPIAYLNGAFLPLAQAQVSVLDRGFLLGDGVYEVIPVYGSQPFRLDRHLDRLARSLDAVRIPDPMSRNEWRATVETLIARNEDGDQSVYLQVTRGVVEQRDHAFPRGVEPTVFLMSSPLPETDPRIREQGVSAVLREDIRWKRCDIKAITLLANVLLRQEAEEAGAAEAILVRDGYATEGAASNLFLVADGTLITPPKGPHLLPGITRDLVLELARDAGLDCEEAPLPADRLPRADELWLSSSTRELLPVTRLDGAIIGDGAPGPVWRRVRSAYDAYKQRLRRGTAESV